MSQFESCNSCIAWVPRAAMKEIPDKMSAEEMDALVKKQAELKLTDTAESDEIEDEKREKEDEKPAEKPAEPMKEEEDPFIENLMKGYDDEPDGVQFLGEDTVVLEDEFGEDEGSDEEDVALSPNDSIFLVGHTEQGHSNVEVWVYEEAANNLYIHHDFALPTYPLALAYVDISPRDGGKANFAAVATFKSEIELWNLDVMDVMEPDYVLGQHISNKSKKKKKGKKAKKKTEVITATHTKAVTALSWSSPLRTLVSGSADTTIRLWDMATRTSTQTFTHHSSSVQLVEWNPIETNILLTGSYDKKLPLSVLDIRKPTSALRFHADGDIESGCWIPKSSLFLASTDQGSIVCYDVKNAKQPLFTLSAHTQPATSVAINQFVPGFFATSSLDKTVKLWAFEIKDGKASVKTVSSRNLEIGSVFTAKFQPDPLSPFILAAGGEGKTVIWDTAEDDVVATTYKNIIDKLPPPQITPPKPSLIDFGPGTASLSSSSSSSSFSSSFSSSSSSSSSTTRPTSEKKKRKKNKSGKEKPSKKLQVDKEES